MARRWHDRFMSAAAVSGDDGRDFDTHVIACALSVALTEVRRGEATLCEATGLDAATVTALLAERFPRLDRAFLPPVATVIPAREIEEEMLGDLLLEHGATALAPVLARIVARRALKPDHLWQDLGLYDRAELGRLLARHFPTLAAANTDNMRWKKFFYRKLCEAEGFSLCSAPSCAQCADFASCFGAEDGESRMAERRRILDRGETITVAAE
ncbi:MAG: nitrogen fixation protein NifQ [Phyllobacteriaceae bacterium]|nr:nitrogen fixation protein NifQ [Phyllobacteriaceae bacterium]